MAASVGVGRRLSSAIATVSGSSLTENFDATFALAADILLTPTFPQEELDRYKTRTRTGLMQQRSNPSFLANEMFARVIYGTHPAARVSLTADALDKMTRDALVAFHKAHYVPDHAVLAIAGDITMAEARKLVGRQARRVEEGRHAGSDPQRSARRSDPPGSTSSRGRARCRRASGSARRASRGRARTTTS